MPPWNLMSGTVSAGEDTSDHREAPLSKEMGPALQQGQALIYNSAIDFTEIWQLQVPVTGERTAACSMLV